MLLLLVYAANVLGAGSLGIASLCAPHFAQRVVFQGAVEPSESIRLLGALWCAVALLSACGLAEPLRMSPVLVLQVVYKTLWLSTVVLPRAVRGEAVPTLLAGSFALLVAVWSYAIPWGWLLARS